MKRSSKIWIKTYLQNQNINKNTTYEEFFKWFMCISFKSLVKITKAVECQKFWNCTSHFVRKRAQAKHYFCNQHLNISKNEELDFNKCVTYFYAYYLLLVHQHLLTNKLKWNQLQIDCLVSFCRRNAVWMMLRIAA